jgi:mediator of RNA polymerase II transcription subunit 5
MLLLSPSCPLPVLSLCSPRVLTLFNDKSNKTKNMPPGIDIPSVRRVIGKALGLKTNSLFLVVRQCRRMLIINL